MSEPFAHGWIGVLGVAMSTIEKFRVVYATGLYTSPARPTFGKYSPTSDSGGVLATGHKVVGVTVTTAAADENVAVMRGGLMRGITSADLTGWEPSTGAALWCGSDGKPTTTKPTTGAKVFVGTYLGSGVVDVEIVVIPGLGELSFVSETTPSDEDFLKWDSASSAYVHTKLNTRRWSWLTGGL